LEFTKQWLIRAKNRISQSKSIGFFKYESGPTPSSIVNEAFMEIFVWNSDLVFPEVFLD
jgi:hypothetical protein